MEFRVAFYVADSGVCPMRDFLDALKARVRVVFEPEKAKRAGGAMRLAEAPGAYRTRRAARKRRKAVKVP